MTAALHMLVQGQTTLRDQVAAGLLAAGSRGPLWVCLYAVAVGLAAGWLIGRRS